MPVQDHKSKLVAGSRVVFTGMAGDARNGKPCIILGALPNPSQRSGHQWYDVRFDDHTFGRFLERFLHAETSG
ncbi:MAG TPA: hypothetical protein VFO86_01410, partial [Terriglobia bacterium]|nr:hypothetical protein [Terriglobia bacterium]